MGSYQTGAFRNSSCRDLGILFHKLPSKLFYPAFQVFNIKCPNLFLFYLGHDHSLTSFFFLALFCFGFSSADSFVFSSSATFAIFSFAVSVFDSSTDGAVSGLIVLIASGRWISGGIIITCIPIVPVLNWADEY